MKRWICMMTVLVLLLSAGVTPCAAANKVVNNDRPASDPFFLDDCDSAARWIASQGVEVAFDRDEAIEGVGSVRFVTDFAAYSNANLDIRGEFDAVDLSAADYITFDLYISHPELINASYQITVSIGSGGLASSSTQEWKAIMFMQEFEPGWNRIVMPMTESQSNQANMSKADNFRMYFHTINLAQDVEDLTLRLDNIKAHTYGTVAIPLLDCDSADGWGGAVAGVETQNHTQGEGALIFTATPITSEEGDHNIVKQRVFDQAVYAVNADYLEFDFYVSDASALAENNSNYGLQVELTSAGRCDAEELEWGIEQGCGQLKDGWNHIKLPIPTRGGNLNLYGVNFFRIHLLSLKSCRDAELVIMLDNMYLSVLQDGIDDFAEEEVVTPPDENPENQGEASTDSDVTNPGTAEDSDSSKGDAALGDEELLARKALTATRAKMVAIIFVFFIIGFDIVVVLLRRREAAEPVLAGVEAEDVATIEQEPAAAEQPQEPAAPEQDRTE